MTTIYINDKHTHKMLCKDTCIFKYNKKNLAFLTWLMMYAASHLGWLVLHPSKLYSHTVPT